jgi:enoyl-CoA hydratase/carnithine racemase
MWRDKRGRQSNEVGEQPMGLELVKYRRAGHVGTVRLDSPQTGNRFSYAMLQALDRALIQADEDIDAKVVRIEASGADFSVGDESDEECHLGGPGARLAQELQNARRFEYLTNLTRPTIAVVRGQCAGTGLTIAMCCDFVICSDDARLSEPAVKNGAVPSFALWPFFTWHKKAKELLFGREISGADAAEWGVVTRSVPADQLAEEVERQIDFLLLAPADALVWTKEMVAASTEARGAGVMWRDSAVYHALGA